MKLGFGFLLALLEILCVAGPLSAGPPFQTSTESGPKQAPAASSQTGEKPMEGWHGDAPFKQVLSAGPYLGEHGIRLNGWLQLDGSSVAFGGQPNPLPFDGQYLLDLTATVDPKRLFGWPGGTLMVDAQTHSGPSILTHQMPALQDPDNMDAYSETSVDRAWYHQDLLRQKVQLQVGLM